MGQEAAAIRREDAAAVRREEVLLSRQHPWSRLPLVGVGLAAIGLAVAAASARQDPTRFLAAWLVAFVFFQGAGYRADLVIELREHDLLNRVEAAHGLREAVLEIANGEVLLRQPHQCRQRIGKCGAGPIQ